MEEAIASNRNPDRRQNCPANKIDDSASQVGYQITESRAYWFSTSTSRSSPCNGVGVGALGQIFNPVCYLPSELQFHHTRAERKLWLTSTDGKNFRVLDSSLATAIPEQQPKFDKYAIDSTSVYYYSEKLKNADPKSFEVLSPPGNDINLAQYSFAKDHESLFIDGWRLPGIDLEKIEWLEILCTDAPEKCDSFQSRIPSIGRVESNIIFIDRLRATLFSNIETSKMFCSRKQILVFCTIGGKRYLIDSGIREEARLVIQPED
ncbi:DKNYY domain-containing protein [Pseudomonas putida]|uniref:Uncharacterized protein n=1 Tax=Pseudomonas putida TaxID=303 RepID=A0A1Q9QVR9_PSEPU|nr:DKNYY domain-containing protein [Pseudomonas putida]OLS59243.1 hypothetical protein PSEMO_57520 [Pseudomonas putida]